ncbi:morphogenetic protein [Citrobacter koseri]
MTERGMIFNGEMVRAILDGRKTQTRRIVKSDCMDIGEKDDGTLWPWREHDNGGDYWYPCPFGEVGDRIWVRETWQAIHDSVDEFGHVEERTYSPSIPKEKDRYWHTVYAEHFGDENREDRGFPWRPAIHMPRWASRILLEITSVRVERLNDISQKDAQAEGMELTGWRPTYSDPDSGGEVWTPYDNFAELWQSLYGVGSWLSNPWVWVIEFRRIEGGAA